MTRRAPFLIIPILALALLPLLWFAGCKPPPPPPTQAVSNSGPGKEEIVEPPSAEERKVALERIEAAIKAHGGATNLRKLNRHIQHLQGQLKTAAWGLINAKPHDVKLDLPDRLCLVVKAITRDGPQHIILAIDHDQSWRSINGDVAPLDALLHASVKEELYYRGVMTLLPLTGAEYVIKPIDGATVSGRPTKAVRVGAKDHHTVDLFFDAESNLLVRTYHPVWNEAGTVQKREVLLGGHKDFEGVKLPTIVIDKRDNDRLVDCTAEYEFVKEFDPKVFARPQ